MRFPAFLTSVSLLAVALVESASTSELADLIESGQHGAAVELIQQGVDVNEAQGDGTTPLHWAVYRNDVELVIRLLEGGANANAANAFGSNPLGEAIKLGNVELVQLLLAADADPSASNSDGQTSLMLVVVCF